MLAMTTQTTSGECFGDADPGECFATRNLAICTDCRTLGRLRQDDGAGRGLAGAGGGGRQRLDASAHDAPVVTCGGG